MDERWKDPPAEANVAEARQHAEADRDKAEQRREDKAEQQEAAEGERRRAEKGRELHEEIRATAEVMRDMGENAREAADQGQGIGRRGPRGRRGAAPALGRDAPFAPRVRAAIRARRRPQQSEPPPRDRAGCAG
jgi:hypothetical protein